MKQDITTFRIRKRQNRAQRPAFAFQEPLYAGFSAGSPVLNEVELGISMDKPEAVAGVGKVQVGAIVASNCRRAASRTRAGGSCSAGATVIVTPTRTRGR